MSLRFGRVTDEDVDDIALPELMKLGADSHLPIRTLTRNGSG